jgi:LysR family transcriptional regulator, nitrogen assimilation regulatory protein
MTLDIRKIRYFVSVFEEGSLSRAAERENIVQPALSTQIKQLETQLCVKLFERSTQGIQPTPAGQHFYRLCKELLRTLEAAGQQMRDFGGTISGFIRVGIMPSICRGPLATILTRYSDAYPTWRSRFWKPTAAPWRTRSSPVRWISQSAIAPPRRPA